jgi:uncharacterized protein YcbX
LFAFLGVSSPSNRCWIERNDQLQGEAATKIEAIQAQIAEQQAAHEPVQSELEVGVEEPGKLKGGSSAQALESRFVRKLSCEMGI